ncbi:MAG: radical SAM protein [Clostridiales bacterium]|nr:radical SAM protein [Clostridiales bacterium]
MNNTDNDLLKQYAECRICPRNCGANRIVGNLGRCRVDSRLFVARAALHMWEEPCLSDMEGSGTVFFSGCNLGCVFCQNHSISRADSGKEISIERLAEIFLDLQGKGANNINLVTAGHYLWHLIPALKLAKNQGLTIPIVYNTSGYEKVESLQLLDGLIDVYLPDFKYWDPELAKKYSFAEDYPKVVKPALDEMVRQAGKPIFDEKEHITKGVIVRHLLLPEHLMDSKRIVEYLYNTYGDRIYISLMNQYTPMDGLEKFPELTRKVKESEYDELVDYAIELGVENGFIQEGETAEESFIPVFDCEGV